MNDQTRERGLIDQQAREIDELRAALSEAGDRACDWVNGDASPPDVGIYEYVTGATANARKKERSEREYQELQEEWVLTMMDPPTLSPKEASQ